METYTREALESMGHPRRRRESPVPDEPFGGQADRAGVPSQLKDELLQGMVITNCANGNPPPTHDKGGVLDLITVDRGITIANAGVRQRGMAASDHRMAWAKLMLLHSERTQAAAEWRPASGPDWGKLECELEGPLQSWHAWFKKKATCVATENVT